MNHINPIALVTGCSSGIGKALAKRLVESGYTTVATARNINCLDELKTLGCDVQALDVNNAQAVASIANYIHDTYGKLDLLINNAGFAVMGAVLDTGLEQWRDQFDTNVFAPVVLANACIGALEKANGTIINIGSVSGVTSTPFSGPYCASKAALHALSDSMRMELAPFGVKVVIVQPGAIESDFGNNANKALDSSNNISERYAPLREQIEARAHASQVDATPAVNFAMQLVDMIDGDRLKPVIRIGNKSRMMPFLKRWLPTPMLDKIFSKKFGLHRFKPIQ